MNEEQLYRMINEKEGMATAAMPALMRKVYVWMTLAMIITGITSYIIADSPALIYQIMTNKMLNIGLLIGTFVFVIIINKAIMRLSLTVGTLLFIAFSILMGVMLSSIFIAYTMTSIANVFFITAGTFAAMSLIGLFTKADLSSLGKILMMALIGLIIATVVNVFFIHSSGMQLIMSYVGVLIFVGLTAYDTQQIKKMLLMADNMTEEAHKIALLGSLSLYLDFINLFLYLLRIFGGRNE